MEQVVPNGRYVEEIEFSILRPDGEHISHLRESHALH